MTSFTGPMSYHNTLFRSRGVTLVELMVAMALGLVIVVTVGYAYLGAKESFRYQIALSTIQENTRYAFEFMGVDIRMAGYTGSTTDSTIEQPSGWSLPQQDLKNYPLRGYEEGVSSFPSFPVTRPRKRGDALAVVHADNVNEYSFSTAVTPNPDATNTITLSNWPSTDPKTGGLFVAADYTHTAVFAVSAFNKGSKTLSSGTNLGSFSGPIGSRKLYPLRGATYYIAENPAGEPALYRYKVGTDGNLEAEELVEGVYDMQVLYGVDAPSPATTITKATCDAGKITFDSINHGLSVGDRVLIADVNPSGFNGTYIVTETDTDNFTIARTCPGSYVSGGTAANSFDKSVDGYWTADQVEAGTDGTTTLPDEKNAIPNYSALEIGYWKRVVSVRITLTLTSRQTEKVSTTGSQLTKTFTTTFAVRNRI